jgi:hypothetical protein
MEKAGKIIVMASSPDDNKLLTLVFGVFVVVLVALCLAQVAEAAVTKTTVSLSVNPGNLSIAPGQPTNVAVSEGEAANEWQDTIAINDNRGDGAGWSISVSSLNYYEVNRQGAVVGADPGLESTVTGFSVASEPTSTPPVDEDETPVTLPSEYADSQTPVTVYKAERGTGMGDFLVTMNVATTGAASGREYEPVIQLNSATGPS